MITQTENISSEIIKVQLKKLFRDHTGRQSAIKRKDILKMLDLTPHQDRKLRLIISELRREGFSIMFATNYPQGYYLPETLAELKECTDNYLSYIKDLCITLRALKVKGTQYVHKETQGRLIW